MDYRAELSQAISDRAAVVVVGTGVSKAITGGAPCADWVGLIDDGIQFAVDHGSSEAWQKNLRANLEFATTENDLSALIGVASQVQQKIRDISAQTYLDWMRSSVGRLSIRDASVARALGGLECPILTTNYDRLLEDVLKVDTVVWDDQNKMRDLMKGGASIGHLHGVWNQPDSVVLSATDYQRLLSSDPAQHLQSAHYSLKSFVFVGYGSGLADPNFSNLLEVHRKLFPESTHDHFRLCREDELAALLVEHAKDSIRPIAYGAEHEDLAPFLRSLTRSSGRSTARVDTVAFAAEAILDQLRAETVVADELTSTEDRQLHEITVPPVFLPLPHEQFASYQMRDEGEERPTKRDPSELYGARKIVVVAGEEGAGVSTAIRWLVSHAATKHHRAAPLYIDARTCRSQSAALRRELTKEALSRRLIDKKLEDLPTHVLALDNVKPAATRAYQSLIDDLRASNAAAIFIGVRQGDEAELVDSLAGSGRPVEVVYLGKPGRQEVKALVRMIAPTMSDSLAQQVIDVVRRERLQRTPFNIALLIVLLARGVGSTLNSSDTAVLDKYVQLLLGRSGSFLDPRWTLDPQNREAVLAHLAKFMVEKGQGGLQKSAAIEQVEQYFESVDWQEDADATLETFRAMRILRIQDGIVQFQQTAYLHLFAAKAAIDDGEFLTKLLNQQLYFGPIIRHYAALVRQSDRVVRELLISLKTTWPSEDPKSPIYGPVAALEATDDSAVTTVPDAAGDKSAGESEGGSESLRERDEEWGDDDDRVPFPLDDPENWSLTQQLIAMLDLSSRVVRDSDQVADLGLKDELFATVLDRWGYLTDVMAGDDTFGEVLEAVVLGLPAETDEEKEQKKYLLEDLRLTMPMFVALTGINATLASRKLLKTYERSVGVSGDSNSLFEDVAGTLFAFLVAEPGWASRLPEVGYRDARKWVMPNFIFPLVRIAWNHQQLSLADEASIEEFFRQYFAEHYKFQNGRHQRIWIGDQIQRLKKERALNVTRRLGVGERAIDSLNRDFDLNDEEAAGDV